MSKERTSVFGAVVLTICLTATIIFAGVWFLAPRYFNQPTASAPVEVASEPAPRRSKSPQASTNTSGQNGAKNRASSSGSAPSPTSATVDSTEARANEDAE